MTSLLNSTAYKENDLVTSMAISVRHIGVLNYLLYINPQDFTWAMGNKRQDVSTNLVGNFESNFPDDYDTLQVSGTTGGFKHPKYGYLAEFREGSLAYQKFLLLMELIKNNGVEFEERGKPENVDWVTISFLGVSWKGNFRSFTYNELEEKPLEFEIEFEFQVEKTLVVT